MPLLLLLVACRPAISLDDAMAPDSVSHVAILELDDGAVAATSPLLPFERGRPLWVDPERDLLLLGFDAATLADPSTGELPPSLESDPVVVAAECDPHLPAPLWIASYRDGVRSDPPDAPALTAPFLFARCVVPDEIILDVRGGEGLRCTSKTRVLDPCRAHVDSTGCWIESVEVSFEGARAKCLDMLPPGWSCRQISQERSLFECDLDLGTEGWEVEVFAADADEGPAFATASVRFGELDPILPEQAAQHDSARWSIVNWGQAFDLLPLEDRVVVSAIEGSDRSPCPFGQRRRFAFIGLESMEIRTATAPACLEQLSPSLDDAAFVAGFQSDVGEAMLGRFDADGRLLGSITLASGYSITTIVTLPAYYVVLLDRREVIDIAEQSELRFIRADLSLAGGYLPPPPNTLFALAGLDEADRIAVYSREPELREVRIIRVPSGEIEQSSELPLFSGFFPTSMISGAGRLLMSSVDDREDIFYDLDPLVSRRLIGTVNGPGLTVSAIPWPGLPLVIAGGSGDPLAGFPPQLSFADLRQERFLAGRRSLDGFGPISKLRSDAAGRVWALLPWDGSIVRLSP